MKIALINLPSNFLISDKVFPPLGLLYVGTYLRQYDHQPEIYDMAGKSKEIIFDEIQQINADIYGISATTPQYPLALEIKKTILAKKPVIIGGAHATYMPGECEKDFDCVIIGEGERAFLKTLHQYEEMGALAPSVIGFPFDLDVLPIPDRTMLLLNGYQYILDGRVATSLISSRGCPYHCAFCIETDSVRYVSAKKVIEEIDNISSLGYCALVFYDDIFTANKTRLQIITHHLKQKDIIYRCFTHVLLSDEDRINILAETGCKEIGIGIESGDNEILKNIKKGFTAEEALEAVQKYHARNIRVKTFIIVGLPGESCESIEKTRQWLQQAKPDAWDISVFIPYPGCDIYHNKAKYDIKFSEHLDWNLGWYKGITGNYVSQVETSQLAAKDIVAARDMLDRELWDR